MRDRGRSDRFGPSLQAGLSVSTASLIWTVTAGGAAVGIGVASGSLLLVAFGAIGLLDGAGSATLVVHFRHALRHEAISERHERLALQVVTIGMVLVGVATVVDSGVRLGTHAHGSRLTVGIVIAGTSVLVLATLAVLKRRIARRIPSHALHADAWLSATGAMLALITMLGTGLDVAYGWWWMDPVAAVVVGASAIVLGFALARAERR
jgi:divalent metal cation (Fe/Co/Zn/Cd) transporter